ncbi:hypothetical protein MKEN_00721900 [Mycena kentingensis (nom. inval.)]|nr:hypothetical protein MKEN_00721900 [Mycena kentingensis (nom. inval.)]
MSSSSGTVQRRHFGSARAISGAVFTFSRPTTNMYAAARPSIPASPSSVPGLSMSAFRMCRFCRRRRTCGLTNQPDGASVPLVLPPPFLSCSALLGFCSTGFAAGGERGGLAQQADGTSVPAGACHLREQREDYVLVCKTLRVRKGFAFAPGPDACMRAVWAAARCRNGLWTTLKGSTAGGAPGISGSIQRCFAAGGKVFGSRCGPCRRMPSGFSGTFLAVLPPEAKTTLCAAARPFGHVGELGA